MSITKRAFEAEQEREERIRDAAIETLEVLKQAERALDEALSNLDAEEYPTSYGIIEGAWRRARATIKRVDIKP